MEFESDQLNEFNFAPTYDAQTWAKQKKLYFGVTSCPQMESKRTTNPDEFDPKHPLIEMTTETASYQSPLFNEELLIESELMSPNADWQTRFHYTSGSAEILGQPYHLFVTTYSPTREAFYPYPTLKDETPKILVIALKYNPIDHTASKISAEYKYSGELSGLNYTHFYKGADGSKLMDQVFLDDSLNFKVAAHFSSKKGQDHPFKYKFCFRQIAIKNGATGPIYNLFLGSDVGGDFYKALTQKNVPLATGVDNILFWAPILHNDCTFGITKGGFSNCLPEQDPTMVRLTQIGQNAKLYNANGSIIFPMVLPQDQYDLTNNFDGNNLAETFSGVIQSFSNICADGIKSVESSNVVIGF